MSAARPHVFIVENDPSLGSLIALIMDEEGYGVSWELQSSDTFAHIRQQLPNVVLLDLPFGGELLPQAGRELLDALRADERTRGIPVVVLATSAHLAQLSAASFNVRASVTKPFNIDDLLGAVRVALDQPPLHAAVSLDVAPTDTLRRAEALLSRGAREVMLAWMQRLRSESPWGERSDLDISDQLDTVPILLEAITLALRYGGGEQYFSDHPDALRRVRQHAVIRKAQQIDLRTVIREYALLRDEIWKLFRRSIQGTVEAAALFDLQYAVNYTLDCIIETTIPSWLEAPPDAML